MNKANLLGRIFNKKDLAKIIDLLENKDFSGWFGNNTGGTYLRKLEEKVANFCGVKYAATTCSGSTAIYTALRAVGVGQGDIVAVPTFTHIGSVAPIILCGAKPYFVDVEPKYGTFNPEELMKATKKFKAIIVQHFLGTPCQMDMIRDLAGDAYIIEDASLGLGSLYHSKMVGNLGDVAAFSIGGGRTKIICAGEGGIVTTNNAEIAEKAHNIRNHGDRYADKDYFGFNFRMSEINALIALCQMNKIKTLLETQKTNAEYLINNLPSYLSWLGCPSNTTTNYYIVGCLFKRSVIGMPRNTFLRIVTSDPTLKIGRGIPRRSVNAGYSKLISDVKFYKEFADRRFPNSEMLRDNIVWLDWHRFPRTKHEIDDLLACFEKVIEA